MKKLFKKKIKKGNRGITLIALVVTIIVLLILAGISIGMLTGNNGILKQSRDAKNQTNTATMKEKVRIAYLATITKSDEYFTEQEFQAQLDKEFTGDEVVTIEKSTDGKQWIVYVNDVEIDRVERNEPKVAKFVDEFSSKTHGFGSFANITKIERATTLPQAYETESNKVSSTDSDYPIYMWNENNILYWYSEASHPKLPSNSSYSFTNFFALEDAGGLSDFDTSDVTDMNSMFMSCHNLISINSISNWNTINVENMSNMFSDCTKLELLNLSKWNVKNVVNMGSMFNHCIELNNLNLSGWNTSQVTNMTGMFGLCLEMTTIDVSSFNTANVTNMQSMFNMHDDNGGTPKLSKIIASSNFVVEGVTNSTDMFKGCTLLPNYDSSKTDKTMAYIGGYFSAN